MFQLRTELSPLRCHKYRHKFADTPTNNCICNQGIENTGHFLFICRQFAMHRICLAIDVTNILREQNLLNLANNVEVYLYGNPDLSLENNRKVLLATLKYIKKTKRFSREITFT